MSRLKIAVSSCLLGEAVRYDGRDKKNDLILSTLSEEFELVSFCPEVAIGLGVPRPPIALFVKGSEVRCCQVNDRETDVTDDLVNLVHQEPAWLGHISGYILKSASPSCGLNGVKLWQNEHCKFEGVGVFAQSIQDHYPDLPLISEQAMQDAGSRDHFLVRVRAYSSAQMSRTGVKPI